MLEVDGPGVRDGLAPEFRKIWHPLPGSNCASLVLGRQHQAGFWQRVLRADAFNTLSREHLEVEVREERHAGANVVHVRSRNEVNPIRVCSCPEAIVDAPACRIGEWTRLRDGNLIVMNSTRTNGFWLMFTDLRAEMRPAPAHCAAPATPIAAHCAAPAMPIARHRDNGCHAAELRISSVTNISPSNVYCPGDLSQAVIAARR